MYWENLTNVIKTHKFRGIQFLYRNARNENKHENFYYKNYHVFHLGTLTKKMLRCHV